MRKVLAALAAPALVAVVLAGCGSSEKTSTSSTTSTSASSTIPTQSVDSEIAAKVPAKYKSKSSLIIATEPEYAPNEFIENGKIVGMDPDLMTAIAEVLGLKVSFAEAQFTAIIPGIKAGKYDVGASSFTDTAERQKEVEFVDYFEAGQSFYAKSSSSPNVETVADLCGKTVAVEKGTVEQEEAEKQNKLCSKEGKKPITLSVFTGQSEVNLAVSSGRSEVGMADSPVAAYQVKQSNGGFKIIGKTFEVAPYGIALPKGGGLAQPFLEALEKLIANGTYIKIMQKWGIAEGAIKKPGINEAKS
ncbi:MAG TPA: ABC transporter substrate-binding protein [Solirubrobacteraceae bacterium]|nr:ABC transporter substrate-binding protein [Solirubrobacteraceae bacterium]